MRLDPLTTDTAQPAGKVASVATALETGAERVEWDLSDLYAGEDDPKLAHDLSETKAAAADFHSRFAGRIGELSAAELADATAELERVIVTMRNVTLFARLRFAGITRKPIAAMTLASRMPVTSAASVVRSSIHGGRPKQVELC